jgi:PleD family two-component response regulator
LIKAGISRGPCWECRFIEDTNRGNDPKELRHHSPALGVSDLIIEFQRKLEPSELSRLILGHMGQSATQRTILVVEDEFFIRMSAVATLEDAGFVVLEAKNSLEALDMLSRHVETTSS